MSETQDPLAPLLAEASADEQAGRLDAAEARLAAALRQAPEHPHALHLSGIVAFRRGREGEARALMERSIALAPDMALYHRNICAIYRALGRLEEGREAGLRAIALAPDDAHAYANLAIIHYDLLELEEGLACSDRALELSPELPDAHFERAEVLLLRGRLDQGWEEYEWRFKLPQAGRMLPKGEVAQWDGERRSDGRLLLIGDQGFGDVIQFARYIPWAAARWPDMVAACSAEMRPVLAQFPQLASIHDRWEDVPSFDAYCPLSGLPRLAGTRVENIPGTVPYLHADPARILHWAGRLDRLLPSGLPRVALAWAGRPAHNNDRNRSTTLERLAPILAVPGVAFVSLQKGPARSGIGAYFGAAPLLNLGPSLETFADTMAVLACVDLVIAVDTSVVHLAGAMARPVWTLLPFAPDWRWLLNRPDTPWYPTMRLYRQTAPRAWDELAGRVATDLAGFRDEIQRPRA